MSHTNQIDGNEIKSIFTVYNVMLNDDQETFSKFSPFQITKFLNTISDNWDWISYSNNDKVFTFKDYSKNDDKKFENVSSIIINNKSIAITIKINKNFNQVKGVIFSKALISMNDDEILESLIPLGVTEVYRFTRKDVNNLLRPTGSFAITFNNQRLPEKVKIAFLDLNVYPLFEKPMQCSHCKLLGHTKKRCLALTAFFCNDCFHPIIETVTHNCYDSCKNCQGNHLSDSKTCPAFLKEKCIIKMKTTKGISYKEARRRFNLTSTTLQTDVLINDSSEAEKIKIEKDLLNKLNTELVAFNKEQTKSIQLLTKQNENLNEQNTILLKQNEILNEQNEVLMKKLKINQELMSKLLIEVKNAPKSNSDLNSSIVEIRKENENLKTVIEKDKKKLQTTKYYAMCMKKFIYDDKIVAGNFERYMEKNDSVSSEEEYEYE